MATATLNLSPTTLAAARQILAIRGSALRDLQCVPTSYPAWRAEWVADRVRDVDFANRYLELLAGKLGLEPGELVQALAGEGGGS